MDGEPEDRLRAVERHAYTIQALAELAEAVSTLAHLTNRADLGFLFGFLAERLRQETDALLIAATRG